MAHNDPINAAKYEKKIWWHHLKITSIKDEYNKRLLSIDSEIVSAYVTFKTMAAQRHALEAHQHDGLTKLRLFCCGLSRNLKKNSFLQQYKIEVKPTVEPEQIKWENNGNLQKEKCIRFLIIFVISILVLFVCFGLISTLSIQEKKRNNWYKSDCNNVKFKITNELALKDFSFPEKYQQGLMNCYCK